MSRRSRKNNKYLNKNLNKKNVIICLSILIFMLLTIFISIIISSNIKASSIQADIADNSSKENNKTSEENNENKTENNNSNSDTTFTITALGDILCHNTQYMDAYDESTKTYDFSYVFDDIKYYTQIGDLTIANLETSFAGEERGYSNYPTFNTPDALASSLKRIGVDIITTAGNHALDMGYSGLERTIDVLDQADISHLGTYKSKEERDSVFIKYVKGVKIAFIDYTYGTNGIPIPKGKEYSVNLIDKDLIKSDIEAAKAKKPDVIIASMHWGTEYKTYANSEQIDLSDFLFQNGVDVILGNHPHVLQPMEKKTVTLEDGTQKECFASYALGNFTADQTEEITRDSIILNLKMTKHSDGKLSIDNADYVPIYMYKNKSVAKKKFKILDIEKTIAAYDSGSDTSIPQSVYNNLKTQLNKIIQIVGPKI